MNLGSEEARTRLTRARVARLATADEQGRPHVVPVTFTAFDDAIAIAIDSKPKRTTDLKRLRNIRVNPRVSVLADHYEDDWPALWWARADGTARILESGDATRQAAIERLVDKYPQYREQVPEGPVILVAVTSWSGWAFASRPWP